jgi:hypothetical protein
MLTPVLTIPRAFPGPHAPESLVFMCPRGRDRLASKRIWKLTVRGQSGQIWSQRVIPRVNGFIEPRLQPLPYRPHAGLATDVHLLRMPDRRKRQRGFIERRSLVPSIGPKGEHCHAASDYYFVARFWRRWRILRLWPLGLSRGCGHRLRHYFIDPSHCLHVGDFPLSRSHRKRLVRVVARPRRIAI